ncbi:hypothetical protein AB205_0026620 [Aquarana catesbeiana]|uniref:ATP synthase subunit gamma, mitochondrial n=1 Tax=Aquarana catesbeiana TaxID=8400 RepID=A0A2G9QJ95_AQUCT|nr:hypothetical protein AB205_0026620 [Aquarana catesbeiana]
MATLKDITRRLKSIKNIQKITKSMKMVAAAKYAKAERELKPARVYGTGALGTSARSFLSFFPGLEQNRNSELQDVKKKTKPL